MEAATTATAITLSWVSSRGTVYTGGNEEQYSHRLEALETLETLERFRDDRDAGAVREAIWCREVAGALVEKRAVCRIVCQVPLGPDLGLMVTAEASFGVGGGTGASKPTSVFSDEDAKAVRKLCSCDVAVTVTCAGESPNVVLRDEVPNLERKCTRVDDGRATDGTLQRVELAVVSPDEDPRLHQGQLANLEVVVDGAQDER